MAKLNFTFEKPYDEVDIDGETYKLYFDDESLKKYRDQAAVYHKEANAYIEKQSKLAGKEQAELPEGEFEKLEAEGIEFAKNFIEVFLGKGSFEKLYAASGKSILNFMPLIEYIFTWLESKVPDVDNQKKDYYTKKRKK